jgi:Flp pilus assembly protein TadD
MSGGPVLNAKGELVGIHGRALKNTEQTNTGFNLGIGINTFLRLSAKIGVNAEVPAFSTQAATDHPKADDFFVQALNKYEKGDKQGALADFNTALKINPNNAAVYLNRDFFRSRLGDKQGGIADIQKGFELLEQQAITTNNQRVLQLMRKLRF